MVAFADVRRSRDFFNLKAARFEDVFVQVSATVLPSGGWGGDVEFFRGWAARAVVELYERAEREDDGEDEESRFRFEKISDVREHGEGTVASVEDVEHPDAIEFAAAAAASLMLAFCRLCSFFFV